MYLWSFRKVKAQNFFFILLVDEIKKYALVCLIFLIYIIG